MKSYNYLESVQQYLDLYRDAGQLLADNSCSTLNACREEARRALAEQGLPSRKSELYRYTDVPAAFAPDYGLNLSRLEMKADPYKAYRCSVPNMGTSLFYMVNDWFYEAPHARQSLPEGLYVGSLRAYADAHPHELGQYYARLADVDADGVTALNTLLSQDGLLIIVPDGLKLTVPLQVVNLLHSSVNLMTNRRTLVLVGDEADVSLLFCNHTLDRDVQFLNTHVVETYVGRGASLHWYDIEETEPAIHTFQNEYISLDAGSRLEHVGITLRNGVSRHTRRVTFRGEHSSASLLGGVVATGLQHVDNHLVIDHSVPNCQSDILYKYVLDGKSVGAFAGRVLVRPDAQKTESVETNSNLCVSPDAHMYTQPMLEIYADDVKCNHGSTVGQIDEAALFYMAQRGVSPDEARLLLQHAFVNEVISRIELPALRDRLSLMVEQRFRHASSAGCPDCGLCKTR